MRACFHRRVLHACVWFGKCALACACLRAYARARVWLAPTTTSGTLVLVLLAQAAGRAQAQAQAQAQAAQLGPLRRLLSLRRSRQVSRLRCLRHQRGGRVAGIICVARACVACVACAIRATRATCAACVPWKRGTLACVAYADGRASACACACVLAFASVCVRVREVCACWLPWCHRPSCRPRPAALAASGRQMPALAEPMWELLEYPYLFWLCF